MMSKKHYVRANGLRSIVRSLSTILAPALAGALLAFSELSLILWIDIVTFSIAIIALVLVHIPQPPANTSESPRNLIAEAGYGFRYLIQRRGLLGLLISFTTFNFFIMIGIVLLAPMILARTGNNEVILGGIQSAIDAGGVAGGMFISIRGEVTRKVRGIFLALALGSLPLIWLGIGQHYMVWMVAAFFSTLFLPIADALFGAVNQAKVNPDVQGKVFASSRMISYTATPLAIVLSGILADSVFEPAMESGGRLSDMFGWLVGTGPGSGMALLFVLSGALGVLISAISYLSKPIRNLETELPDHDIMELDAKVTPD